MKTLENNQFILIALFLFGISSLTFGQEREKENYMPRKLTQIKSETSKLKEMSIPSKHSAPLMYCFDYRNITTNSKKITSCRVRGGNNLIEGFSIRDKQKIFEASYRLPKDLILNFGSKKEYRYTSHINLQGKVNSFGILNKANVLDYGYFWESQRTPVELNFGKLKLIQEESKNLDKPSEVGILINNRRMDFKKGKWTEFQINGSTYLLYISYSIASKRKEDGNCVSGGYNLRGVIINKKLSNDLFKYYNNIA